MTLDGASDVSTDRMTRRIGSSGEPQPRLAKSPVSLGMACGGATSSGNAYGSRHSLGHGGSIENERKLGPEVDAGKGGLKHQHLGQDQMQTKRKSTGQAEHP